MKKYRSIIQFGILIIALLLAIWSQSWFLIVLVFVSTVFLWSHSIRRKVTQRVDRLSRLQYKVGEWLLAIAIAVFAIWFTHRFVYSLLTIRSTSMQPAYYSDELIVINKLAYGPAVNADNSNRYRRLSGYSRIKRGDVIAFYFPEGDTVFQDHSKEYYYFIKRQVETTKTSNPLLKSPLVYNSVSDRIPFIKRIVGLPGDTLKISEGDVWVNRRYAPSNDFAVKKFRINNKTTDSVKEKILKRAYESYREGDDQVVEIKEKVMYENGWSIYLDKMVDPMNRPSPYVFPFSEGYFWNGSFLGPVAIPTKGQTVQLTLTNLPLYRRIIQCYEGNTLTVDNQSVYINNKRTNEYTFKMNYYWVAGDNVSHSFDSRFWGFVPENHIIGKVSWLRCSPH